MCQAPGLAALAGKPVGLVKRVLPTTTSTAVGNATRRALEQAFEVARFSLKNRRLRGGRKLATHERISRSPK